MTQKPREFADYGAALVLAYEEEISGEAFFERLAGFFSGRPRDALLLLAELERLTAIAAHQLIKRHGLATADRALLHARGKASADAMQGTPWPALIADMASNYPAYVQEFEQIERLAPAHDRALVHVLIEHEIAAVEFALLEAAGDRHSLRPLEAYIAQRRATAPVHP